MASFGGLGIGLVLVFGCLLSAVVAKLCYSLCRRKMIINRDTGEDDDCSTSYGEQFFRLVCRKRSSCFQSINRSQILLRDPEANGQEPDLELGSTGQDLLIKALSDEESVEAELMRLHNLAGLPRFLSTIKEETKEDLESEDEKSRGRKGSRRSLRDLMVMADAPSLTPLPSPRSESPSLIVLDSYRHIGLNPLYEPSVTEAELLNTLRSSPPPKFKFLRDAEEKLLRRLMEEAEKKRTSKNSIPVQDSHETKFPKPAQVTEEKEGYILSIILGKNKESELLHQVPQYPPPGSPQVLPLGSSPTTFRPPPDKSPVVPQILLSSS